MATFSILAQTNIPATSPAWDVASQWNVVFGLIGLPLTLLGLWFAYKESRKARTASQAAQDAVRSFRRDFDLATSVADFAKALSISDEIKRLIRYKTLIPLPDRMAEMRGLLINIRGTNGKLSEPQKSAFQSAITNLSKLEGQIEGCLETNTPLEEVAEINQLISADVDALHEILAVLRSQIGSNSP